MSNIVISGYYGFQNAGDEAMLAAILEALLEVIPKAHITVISGSPEETRLKHGVHAVSRLSLLGIIRAIRNADLVISGGGSLLQDVTSDRSLYYYLGILKIAQWFHKKVMIYAQGIGPLQRESAKRAVSKVLNHVDLITVRDAISKAELEAIGVKTPITITADAVLSMHPVDITIGKRILKPYAMKGTVPTIGVSVRAWKEYSAHHAPLAAALDLLVEELGASILFIPMQHESDTKEAQKIARLMRRDAIVLSESYNTTELLSLAGNVDVMIGIRLHALVFASLMEKPVVGISYDPKIDSFLHMIDSKPIGTIEEITKDAIFNYTKDILTDVSLHEKALQRIRALRKEAMKNAHMALSLLQ